jgi:hypothetical protein
MSTPTENQWHLQAGRCKSFPARAVAAVAPGDQQVWLQRRRQRVELLDRLGRV